MSIITAQCFVAERLPTMGRQEPHLLAREGSGENATPGKQPPAPCGPPNTAGLRKIKWEGCRGKANQPLICIVRTLLHAGCGHHGAVLRDSVKRCGFSWERTFLPCPREASPTVFFPPLGVSFRRTKESVTSKAARSYTLHRARLSQTRNELPGTCASRAAHSGSAASRGSRDARMSVHAAVGTRILQGRVCAPRCAPALCRQSVK